MLERREFRLLWAGQSVSLVGDGMLTVSLAFAALDLTGSVTDLGVLLAAARAPLVLAVLGGGVWADRLSRRALMVGADVVRMCVLAAAGALLVVGVARLWELLALLAVYGLASGVFYPASTGLLPLTVASEELRQANALRGLSQSAGVIIGPALAGVVVAAASPGWAIVVDAATFAVSAATLGLLRLSPGLRPVRQAFVRDLADGWHEVRSRTWVWSTIFLMGACANVFTAAFTTLGPGIARAHLGGAGAWAAVLATQGAGAVVGGLLVLRARPRRPMVAANLAWGLTFLPDLTLAFIAPLPAIAATALFSGAGLAIGSALWESALQRNIPQTALSRVSSYDWFGSLAFNPLGLAIMGPIALAIGTRATLLIAAAWLGTSAIGMTALPAIRAIRDDPVTTAPT